MFQYIDSTILYLSIYMYVQYSMQIFICKIRIHQLFELSVIITLFIY